VFAKSSPRILVGPLVETVRARAGKTIDIDVVNFVLLQPNWQNQVALRLTIVRLGRFGPIAKQSDGYFRFQCPSCSELRATVNPKNNLAHCFCCGENLNKIDLLMVQGHEFLPAVEILKN